MKKTKFIKILIWVICSAIALLLLTIVTCHFIVVGNASGRTYDDAGSIPHNRYGLLLATSPITPGGARNFYFDNRIKAAEELYKAGKIDYIIASGGDYTKQHKNGCDEPAAIRDSLVARGVPAGKIILDYDGVRTLNSIVKAKEVYGLDSVTIISQKYHNERAIYLADHYRLHAIGYNAAPSPIHSNRIKNTLREYLACPKMFLDILLGKKPNIKPDTLALPDEYDGLRYLNSVKGHKEECSIVGNFTGSSIDTLYVEETYNDDESIPYEDRFKYHLRSNNPVLANMELFGCAWNTPLLVFEGDVDGDGKDEWGYLHTWMTSQWRQYRIYNYDSKTKTWRHLYYGDLLDTPEYVRSSGVDLVEKGPCPGLIKINYGTWMPEYELRDTIVKPTYTKISEDAW